MELSFENVIIGKGLLTNVLVYGLSSIDDIREIKTVSTTLNKFLENNQFVRSNIVTPIVYGNFRQFVAADFDIFISELLINFMENIPTAVISGSYAMNCFSRIDIARSDVDFYVENNNEKAIINTVDLILQTGIYKLRKSSDYAAPAAVGAHLQEIWTLYSNISRRIQFMLVKDEHTVLETVNRFDLTICQVVVSPYNCFVFQANHFLDKKIHLSLGFRNVVINDANVEFRSELWSSDQLKVHAEHIEYAVLHQTFETIAYHEREIGYHARYRTISGSWVRMVTEDGHTFMEFRDSYVPFRIGVFKRIFKYHQRGFTCPRLAELDVEEEQFTKVFFRNFSLTLQENMRGPVLSSQYFWSDI